MAANLMIQGTMSGAGKSILTAGILRVLEGDGYRVAPFKSQNMALNSFVTADGKEMGRAQVLQAMAAGCEPSADMNPILLKPMGDTTSQVIVGGRAIGNMSAAQYYRMKKDLIPEIRSAYDRLSKDRDIIVIEGAGSPVEINLRENDIVNMGLAKMLDAPVLLVGNIDPGGVFAQFLGTVSLMPMDERRRVKGLIVNKFRGDVSLLEPGFEMFKEYLDIPFAGVVPYFKNNLDEEDSVSERLGDRSKRRPGDAGEAGDKIKIAVIRLPFISNYTDFANLESMDGVLLYYTDDPDDISGADMIILPGTKNTIRDLKWLKTKGLFRSILEAAKEGTLIAGICGGFQMLGNKIRDPEGYEGGGSEEGLGLLPVSTEYGKDKSLGQKSGIIGKIEGAYEMLSGTEVKGYEIHMGVTVSEDGIFPVIIRNNVLGTYLHGIFDTADMAGRLIGCISANKSAEASGIQFHDRNQSQLEELDRLADILRECLDWKLIYDAIGIKR